MDDLRCCLSAYLRQQTELAMPDVICSPGFLSAFFTPKPAGMADTGERVPAAHRDASVERPETAQKNVIPGRLHRIEQLERLVPLDEDAGKSTAVEYEAKREALKAIYYEMNACTRCPLAKTRKRVVFGAGSVDAPLMIIGEAPGADEDVKGMPFVGRAGELLTGMLAAIHLDRTKHTFITNILKCRPPQNRNPESSEIVVCFPALVKQIEIIKPRALLLLGRIAAHTILETASSISSLRAEVHSYKGVPAIVTYHPAALLRYEQYKKAAWEDLKRLEGILAGYGVYDK